MSDEQQTSVSPAGEQIHMPAPSVLPLINAAALALAIVSLTLSWFLVAFGLIVIAATAIKWIADTRSDISHLPIEHGDEH